MVLNVEYITLHYIKKIGISQPHSPTRYFCYYCCYYKLSFLISNTFISNARLTLAKKIDQILSNALKLNFCFLEIIHILHPRYHLKIIGHVLKNKGKIKCAFIHKIIRLIMMK